jgi:hypothetical protein
MTENPAVDDSSVAKTHQAIGAFICAFSTLEHELGEAIKVVLGIENHPAADAHESERRCVTDALAPGTK